MQERFCTCGYPVQVSFTLRGSAWIAAFWSLIPRRGKELHHCPCCRQRLDIHELS